MPSRTEYLVDDRPPAPASRLWDHMLWYQYIIPATAIALAVRAEAIFIGPYWAWLELIPELGSDSRTRRLDLVRRIAIPGIACFALNQLWPATYSALDASLIGMTSGLLLLWPLIFRGLPWQLRTGDLTVFLLYGSLVVLFASAAWLGATVSGWINDDYGSLWAFTREELPSVLFGVLITAFAAGVFDRASSRATDD